MKRGNQTDTTRHEQGGKRCGHAEGEERQRLNRIDPATWHNYQGGPGTNTNALTCDAFRNLKESGI